MVKYRLLAHKRCRSHLFVCMFFTHFYLSVFNTKLVFNFYSSFYFYCYKLWQGGVIDVQSRSKPIVYSHNLQSLLQRSAHMNLWGSWVLQRLLMWFIPLLFHHIPCLTLPPWLVKTCHDLPYLPIPCNLKSCLAINELLANKLLASSQRLPIFIFEYH